MNQSTCGICAPFSRFGRYSTGSGPTSTCTARLRPKARRKSGSKGQMSGARGQVIRVAVVAGGLGKLMARPSLRLVGTEAEDCGAKEECCEAINFVAGDSRTSWIRSAMRDRCWQSEYGAGQGGHV